MYTLLSQTRTTSTKYNAILRWESQTMRTSYTITLRTCWTALGKFFLFTNVKISAMAMQKLTHECSSHCDDWTDSHPGKICVAANFKPGQAATVSNCDFLTKTFNDLTSIGIDGEFPQSLDSGADADSTGIESVLVTATKVSTIVDTNQTQEDPNN
jgi:hypothetical protein